MGLENMWDIAIYVIASYIAVVTLVKLMRHYRNQCIAKYCEQLQHQSQKNQQVSGQASVADGQDVDRDAA